MRTNESPPVSLARGCATAATSGHRLHALFPLTLIGLLTALACGCSPGGGVLARVGDETITVDDFRDAAGSASRYFSLRPDSAKVLLLEDMIKRALLVQAAKRSPFIVDSLVEKQRALVEKQAMVGALAQQLVPRTVPVSDAEVRRLYAWRDSMTRCQVIYVVEENAARAARQAVRSGEPFELVADRFNIAGMLPPGGDVGFVTPGTQIAPLDEVVRESPVGSVQGPFHAPGEGWFVLRVVERKRREQPPFAADSSRLHALLAQRKQGVFMARSFDALKRQYRVTTDPGGIEAIFRYYNTPGLAAALGGRQPTPEQLATRLGCWNGGAGFRGDYTMREAFDDLDQDSRDRPNPSMLPSFDQWVQGRILARVAVIEARRRHLDAEPDVARRVRGTVNDYLLETIYRAEVLDRVAPSEDDVRAFYARNAGYFRRLVSARFQHLTLPDSTMAARALVTLRGTKSLRDAVLISSPGLQVREETVAYPSRDPLWSILEGMVQRESPGAYLGPMRVAAGWRIIQLVSKDERLPRFEELTPEIRQNFTEETAQMARQERLNAYVDSLRRVIPVRVERRKLARVAWPTLDPQSMMGPVGG